jgi:hypothetical protein
VSTNRFGVEIEFKRAAKLMVSMRVGDALGIGHVHCLPYKANRCTLCKRSTLKENAYTEWAVMTDRTVTDYYGDVEVGGELISPVLTVEEFGHVNTILEVLQSLGADVDNSTGLHVHVDVSGFTAAQRVRIVEEWFKQEDAFFAGVEGTRSRNPQCESYVGKVAEQKNILKELSNANNKDLLARLQKVTSKQRSMSVMSYPTLGTFEFRLHHGTLHYPTVSSWVLRILNFVNDSACASRHTCTQH